MKNTWCADLHTWFLWLHETHENSNYILLGIPVEIHLFGHGLQAIYMDPSRLPELLGLSEQDIERLCQAGLAHRGVRSSLAEEGVVGKSMI